MREEDTQTLCIAVRRRLDLDQSIAGFAHCIWPLFTHGPVQPIKLGAQYAATQSAQGVALDSALLQVFQKLIYGIDVFENGPIARPVSIRTIQFLPITEFFTHRPLM